MDTSSIQLHSGLPSNTQNPSKSSPKIPYWNLNLPLHLHTEECPSYLQNLSQKDHSHLHLLDALYTPLNFSQIQHLVRTNNLQLFTRLPSDLHRYRRFVHDVANSHGCVENFMLQERLGWEKHELEQQRAEAKGGFETKRDIKVLRNDWPYGVENGIEHLVVWTKFRLGGEEEGEDEVKVAIEKYVERVFYSNMPKDKVVWFRNWGALKSVHAVEHFHVMLLDPDPRFLTSIIEEPVSLNR